MVVYTLARLVKGGSFCSNSEKTKSCPEKVACRGVPIAEARAPAARIFTFASAAKSPKADNLERGKVSMLTAYQSEAVSSSSEPIERMTSNTLLVCNAAARLRTDSLAEAVSSNIFPGGVYRKPSSASDKMPSANTGVVSDWGTAGTPAMKRKRAALSKLFMTGHFRVALCRPATSWAEIRPRSSPDMHHRPRRRHKPRLADVVTLFFLLNDAHDEVGQLFVCGAAAHQFMEIVVPD